MNRALRARRGFALVSALMILVMLVTFLMAAQGTVMTSRLQIKRSAVRAETAEDLNTLLERMRDRLRRETASGNRKPGDSWQYGNGDSLLLLQADDPIYADLPMVSHRAGDALLSHTDIRDGVETRMQFLLNASGGRSGAVRVR